MAILKQVLEEKKTNVPPEYLDLIAKNIENNVRELEGSLTKVVTLIKLGVNPSFEDVAKLLQIDIDSKRKKITPKKVIKAVSEIFDVTPADIKGSRRTAYVAKCRQTVMYILRNELELPLEKVAHEVNRKDHTTVLHACEKIENLKVADTRFNEKLCKCMTMLNN
jgi:chromosomal replication initiator protein